MEGASMKPKIWNINVSFLLSDYSQRRTHGKRFAGHALSCYRRKTRCFVLELYVGRQSYVGGGASQAAVTSARRLSAMLTTTTTTTTQQYTLLRLVIVSEFRFKYFLPKTQRGLTFNFSTSRQLGNGFFIQPGF